MFKNQSKFLAIALIVALIATSIPQSVDAAEKVTFSDVKKGEWYEASVEWAISKDMITGYKDGTFKPNKNVIEAEFLTMLLRAFEPTLSSSKSENWAEAYYKRAKELNYPVKSYTNIASRNKVVLRKQVAELISSTEGVNFSGNNAIHYLLAFGLAEGSNPNEVTLASFQGDKALTRAEAVQFVKNFVDYGIGGLLQRPTEPSNTSELPPIRL
ncbi:S-layer homology domain-containing protein [Paenibacillus sp. FSL R5-0701]|uniref:S-layer homology domain-containing protein n=1 Tax=Paenibacillus sp. FSL R5-0701 TaxID=2921654 RepID=UPI000FB3528A